MPVDQLAGKEFSYGTMAKKYENFVGKPAQDDYYDIGVIRQNFTCVTLGDSQNSDIRIAVLNWCEDHFGDDWIYGWNRFYFKNPADATMFRLRW